MKKYKRKKIDIIDLPVKIIAFALVLILLIDILIIINCFHPNFIQSIINIINNIVNFIKLSIKLGATLFIYIKLITLKK